MKVKPKKHLGQHFLRDLSIAEDITKSLTGHGQYNEVLEIGPGMGVLTDFLILEQKRLSVIEIDKESVVYLHKKYDGQKLNIIEGDFLRLALDQLYSVPFGLIGNFPYNISSQIFFKVLDYKNLIPEVVCMLQKEVAERICSPAGSRDYGILSVLLQAYYKTEYLFTVEPHVFEPPPKVRSGVIRVTRNEVQKLDCDEVLFKSVIKMAFNMRRKTLRNALKALNLPDEVTSQKLFDQRAEQLTVEDYIFLTNLTATNRTGKDVE